MQLAICIFYSYHTQFTGKAKAVLCISFLACLIQKLNKRGILCYTFTQLSYSLLGLHKFHFVVTTFFFLSILLSVVYTFLALDTVTSDVTEHACCSINQKCVKYVFETAHSVLSHFSFNIPHNYFSLSLPSFFI